MLCLADKTSWEPVTELGEFCLGDTPLDGPDSRRKAAAASRRAAAGRRRRRIGKMKVAGVPSYAPATSQTENYSARFTGFVPLMEDTDTDNGEEAGAPRPPSSLPGHEEKPSQEQTSPSVEFAGGTLLSILILVLNVTYAGVVMGGSLAFLPFLSHGIAMCFACTACSNLWLLMFRRNMPFITVADSFMAVLFATTAENIVKKGGDGTSLLGTLAASMIMCSLVLGAGYVAVGVARVCNVVQFVPSPVMAGYQASIGYLLLDSASTLASVRHRCSRSSDLALVPSMPRHAALLVRPSRSSDRWVVPSMLPSAFLLCSPRGWPCIAAQGCSVTHPSCFGGSPTAVVELFAAVGLGVGLHVAQRYTEGVTRTLLMPTLLVCTSCAFQAGRYLAPDLVDYQRWSLEIPPQQSVFTLYTDLDVRHIDWPLALNEALLAALTAFVPNLLGKLLQYSALEVKFDIDVDYNREIRHAGYSQFAAIPAMMIPTVTYLGMIVAHDLGARSFVPPAMVVVVSALLVFSGSYIVTLVPKAMFAALLFTSGLNLLFDNLKTAYAPPLIARGHPAWLLLPLTARGHPAWLFTSLGDTWQGRKTLLTPTSLGDTWPLITRGRYTDLQRREFALVVMHIALTAWLGMLSAVVLGLLFTAVIFIVQYASHSGVLQSATSLLERSKVARSVAENEVIEQYGATVLIVHLHGMIFFGSANSVLEEVKSHSAPPSPSPESKPYTRRSLRHRHTRSLARSPTAPHRLHAPPTRRVSLRGRSGDPC